MQSHSCSLPLLHCQVNCATGENEFPFGLFPVWVKNLTRCWFWSAAFHTCEPTVLTCGNGRCVPYHYRCDHYDDCGDNSDEVGCLFRPCDPSTEFACNNGRCIAKDYVCNGINNCYDNGTTDEQNCREFLAQDNVIGTVETRYLLTLLKKSHKQFFSCFTSWP